MSCLVVSVVTGQRWRLSLGNGFHELERMESSGNVAELQPWSFPPTSLRCHIWETDHFVGLLHSHERVSWRPLLWECLSLQLSCWPGKSSTLPDASRSGFEPGAWSRSGLRGDLSHALWAAHTDRTPAICCLPGRGCTCGTRARYLSQGPQGKGGFLENS